MVPYCIFSGRVFVIRDTQKKLMSDNGTLMNSLHCIILATLAVLKDSSKTHDLSSETFFTITHINHTENKKT